MCLFHWACHKIHHKSVRMACQDMLLQPICGFRKPLAAASLPRQWGCSPRCTQNFFHKYLPLTHLIIFNLQFHYFALSPEPSPRIIVNMDIFRRAIAYPRLRRTLAYDLLEFQKPTQMLIANYQISFPMPWNIPTVDFAGPFINQGHIGQLPVWFRICLPELR